MWIEQFFRIFLVNTVSINLSAERWKPALL